jgi:GAF domain
MEAKSQRGARTSRVATSSTLLEMVTRFYEGIFTGSAEEQVQTILSEAARVFEADIATWFLVTEDRSHLRLVDVYNDLGDPEARPPAQPYDLNWDARSEEDVHGLTAWTAVSGEPLHVPSIHSLAKVHEKCHAGRWDEWLYPKGIQDPSSGFLCMYAVPLLQPTVGPPRERVVGVLKMERRRMKEDRRRNCFTRSDLESFNVIARIMGFAYFHSERQRSLTLADIGHNLIRPIGDAAFSLDTLLSDAESGVDGHSRLQIKTACNMLRALSRMLAVAKESYNKPLELEQVDVVQDLSAQTEPISASSGRRIRIQRDGQLDPITLTKRSHAALINVVINLLQNATQNSPHNSEVIVNIVRRENDLCLSIENMGSQIPADTIERARSSADQNQRFRGLPRSFQLASRNGWNLDYAARERANRFTLILPLHP